MPMCDAQYQIAVRGGGDLTGASILLICEKDGLHEIELEVLGCIMDDGDVRIYEAKEI